MFHEVDTAEQFQTKISEAGDELVVLDLFTTWSNPHKMIVPKLQELSKELTSVIFLEVDVDKLEEIAERYEIGSIPTFVILRKGELKDKFSGTDIDKLKQRIIMHRSA